MYTHIVTNIRIAFHHHPFHHLDQDFFAVSMFVPLLASYCRSLGASSSFAALISSLYAFIQFFSGPIIGKYSDIVGRRICLQMCFLMSFVSYLMLASSTNLIIILISRIPLGIFKHTQDLIKAYIADHYASKKRAEVLGKFNSVTNMGFIVGPLFGSYVLGRYDLPESKGHGIDRLALITAITFLINFVLTTLFLDEVMSTVQFSSKPSKHSYFKIFQSFLAFMSRKNIGFLWFILTLRFLLSFSVFSSRYDPSAALNPKELGIVTAAGGIASTATSFFAGSITRLYRQNNIRLVLHTSILQGLSIVGLTYAGGLYDTVIYTLPLSFSNAIIKVSLTNLTLDFMNSKGVGLVMGIGTSTVAISRFTAPILANLLSDVDSRGPGIMGYIASFTASLTILISCAGVNKRR